MTIQSPNLQTFKEPRNRFLGFLRIDSGTTSRVIVTARLATKAGGIDSLESILRLLKGLQIRAQLIKMVVPCEWMGGGGVGVPMLFYTNRLIYVSVVLASPARWRASHVDKNWDIRVYLRSYSFIYIFNTCQLLVGLNSEN
jgi:hypothetical protein